jgi:hypothetical protein
MFGFGPFGSRLRMDRSEYLILSAQGHQRRKNNFAGLKPRTSKRTRPYGIWKKLYLSLLSADFYGFAWLRICLDVFRIYLHMFVVCMFGVLMFIFMTLHDVCVQLFENHTLQCLVTGCRLRRRALRIDVWMLGCFEFHWFWIYCILIFWIWDYGASIFIKVV